MENIKAAAGDDDGTGHGPLVVDGIFYATTGKGPADHLISGLTDQDCAMHRGFTDKPVCNPSKDEGHLTGVEPKSEDGQEVTDLAVSEENLPLFISGGIW